MNSNKPNSLTKRAPPFPEAPFFRVVERNGIEPLTSTMPLFWLSVFRVPSRRSPPSSIEATGQNKPGNRGTLRTQCGPKRTMEVARG